MNAERGLENTALDIAMKAHFLQIDKDGKRYIEHPIRVASMGTNTDERIVGLLHDVVEDSDVSLEDLKNAGFSQKVIEALDCLTKREEESYVNYLFRVKGNELARQVKLYDIKDNTDIKRLSTLDEKTRDKLIQKYEFARGFLEY